MEGYEAFRASNGREALDLVGRGMPDLILLDMKMPVMSGWEFAAGLQKAYAKRAPIVVMTAAEDARDRAREIGAESWISKPFELDELVRAVRRFVPPSS